jgi:hypothetical protein
VDRAVALRSRTVDFGGVVPLRFGGKSSAIGGETI